jgi:hypothetical protein
MLKRSIGLGALLIYSALANTSSFGQSSGNQGAAEVQILPNNNVMIVNLGGTLEFCADERDQGCADNSGNPPDRNCSCRVLKNSCDFIIANRQTGEISEPEPISLQAVDFYGGKDSFSIIKEKSPNLLDRFRFGDNECNMMAAAGPGRGTESPPFTPPGCTNCEVPTSPK